MTTPNDSRQRSRGQVLVIFAGAIFLLMMLMALVIDVSWYWVNSLRVQRAADSAALAGAVLLPSDRPNAYDRARKEATKNGYTAVGSNGVTITPLTVNATPRRLSVTISTPVNTFFMRVIGIDSIGVKRTGIAEYTLPVPMGSPENYYGVFGLTRGLTTTETRTQTIQNTTFPNRDTGTRHATSATPTSTSTGWSSSLGNPQSNNNMVNAVNSDNSSYAFTSVSNRTQQWGNFGFQFPLTNGGGTTESIESIRGVEVFFSDVERTSGNNCGNGDGVRIRVQLSWNGGSTWSGSDQTDEIDTNDDNEELGDDNSLQPWTGHSWVVGDFSNSNFLVRWTAIRPNNCNAEIRVDEMEVVVHYQVRRTTTTTQTVVDTDTLPDQNLRGPGIACLNGIVNCFQATGANLNPRGFWGTLLTQGAGNINGDAYQPYYDNPTSSVSPACSAASAANRACYDPSTYYNYAVEMPPNSSGGSVYIYDPVFCAVENDRGTGDRWFDDPDPVSTFYQVYNTRNTLYDQSDDTQVASSGSLFRNIEGADTTMGGPDNGTDECLYELDDTYGDGRDYHNKWYLLASGLTGGPTGTIYRVHTTSTDPNSVTAQRGTDGENSFAIYASAGGGTPKVYGLGAMQAFTPLKASNSGGAQASEFYLAQLEATHKGKTVEIQLWDPGDTDPLTASLQILIPTGTGWSATPVTYSAKTGTTNGSRADGGNGRPNCNTNARTNASTDPIVTWSPGNSTGRFNGCWLTILAQIPNGYAAPQDGWWKIRYTMTGSGTSNDVTTWQVSIRGNPVHLIVP